MNVVGGYRVMLSKTQQDLADYLNISRQTYFRKEKGYSPFTDEEKVKLKELFSEEFPDITIDEIFFNNRLGNVSEVT